MAKSWLFRKGTFWVTRYHLNLTFAIEVLL